jgi:hypothetical protein
VKRGEGRSRLDVFYHKLEFQQLEKELQQHSESLISLKALSTSFTNGDHGGLDYVAEGVRYLRGQSVTEEGLDLSDELYISPEDHQRMIRSEVIAGDVLLTIAGSIGNACVVRGVERANINQAIVKIRPMPEVDADYLAAYLNSKYGKFQTLRLANGAVQLNVNFSEVGNILIYLPTLDVQKTLIAELDTARQLRHARLSQADELLSSLDTYLLGQLGLKPPTEDKRPSFAVRLSQLRGKRLDATSYQPLFAQEDALSVLVKPLRQIANIDSNRISAPTDEDTLVPYIGLPECSLTEVRKVLMRPYKEVKGRSVVRPGDILFARIEPSVFNKKYVLADDLKGHSYAYTSTEFYVVRAKETEVLQQYLYALFFCSFIFVQVKGKTTGSSGRRRIDSEMFRDLQIPIPSEPNFDTQKEIISEFMHRRTEVRKLREEAAKEWAEAKARFEYRLIGEEA